MTSKGEWVVLKQLYHMVGVFDGDVIDKSARDELIRKGLAKRDKKFVSGPYKGCQVNELTDTGMKLAEICLELDKKFGAAT